MKILAVNAGSSSMKFQLFEMPEEKVLVASTFERIGLENSFYSITINGEKTKKTAVFNDHKEAVEVFLDELISQKIISSVNEIEGIGHRIVHGGDLYTKPAIVTDKVVDDIEELSALAPLHNHAHVLGINALRSVLPDALSVVVFDTAFHQTMDEEAYLYPLPYEWFEKYNVRRYGFHGISHKYVSERMAEILGRKDLKIISCHLGNGGSITAVKDGKCIETSMGFTPIAGIPMGSRCGDIDPSIIEYIMKKTDKPIGEITNDLNKNSGFLGISGVSSDARDIDEGIEKGDERCLLARNIYVRRVTGFIAQYNNLLGGADVIIFTAGIGENSSIMRKEIISRLKPLGVIIDEEKNNTHGKETIITTPESKIACYVVPTNEELMIANEVYALSR